MVELRPDEIGQYVTAQWYRDGKVTTILDRLPSGDCVYLGEGGCTIHDRAPSACRDFDCREYFKSHSRNERRDLVKRDPATGPLFERGRELLG